MRAALLLIAILALCGCRQGDDEDCRAVANHYASMVEEAVDDSGEAKLVEDTQAHLPTLKDAVERACTTHEWPRGTRRCILAAQSVAALDDCDPASVPDPDGAGATEERQNGSGR